VDGQPRQPTPSILPLTEEKMTDKTEAPAFALGMLDTVTLAEQGVWMQVRLPNGNPAISPSGANVRMKLMGNDSQAWKEALAERARLRAAEQRALPSHQRNNQDMQAIAKMAREDGDYVLARMCVEWEGFEEAGSTKETPKLISLVHANVLRVVERYPLIRDQMDRFCADQGNFILEPSKT
jgi:hypothetical protein